MKKAMSLLLSLVLVLSLAACGDSEVTRSGEESQCDEEIQSNEVTQSAEASQSAGEISVEKESENSAGIQVDEGLLDVEVTMAASFFNDQTEDQIKAGAEKNGYSNCKINDDGSVTYTMSKKKYAEMLDKMKESFVETIAECLDGEYAVASFVDIQHNDNFSKIDVYVDATQYTVRDKLYVLPFYIAGAYYQAFSGVANEDINVVVNFIDNSTKEVLDTASYKDFVNNIK